MTSRTPLATGLLLAAALGACTPPPRPAASRADPSSQALLAACRTEVDRVYAAQNRADLSTRDERDTPFAANYLPGVTTAGLGASYRRDRMLNTCLDNAGAPVRAPATNGGNPGPTFNPALPASGTPQP